MITSTNGPVKCLYMYLYFLSRCVANSRILVLIEQLLFLIKAYVLAVLYMDEMLGFRGNFIHDLVILASHQFFLSHTYYRIFNKGNTTGATSGAESTYPSGGTLVHPRCCLWRSCCSMFCFLWNVMWIFLFRFISNLLIIVCPSSIYTFSDYSLGDLHTFLQHYKVLNLHIDVLF